MGVLDAQAVAVDEEDGHGHVPAGHLAAEEDPAEALVVEVLVSPEKSGETLRPDEQEAIRWTKPPKTVKSAKFSAADLLLIDESDLAQQVTFVLS